MIYLIDLFCGAGGVTTGAVRVDNLNVIACVNHDPLAIKSHAENHPNCVHYTEDIRVLDLSEMVSMVSNIRIADSDAKIYLWASLECTNFSKAKGGLPRNADSRTLAEHLFRYIDQLDPEIIFIENVEEFMSWGPLDENGKPISMKKGCDYEAWVDNVCNRGYMYDHKILNAADFGAYTSRKRFFGQFAKPHMNISWPQQTHAKPTAKNMPLIENGTYKKWKAVKDVLDLDDHGTSIFGRKKNLSDNTYKRCYAGLIKFVAGGEEAFLIKWNSVNGKTGKYVPPNINNPSPTVSTQNRLGVAGVTFLAAYHGNGHNCHSTDSVSPTIPTKDSVSLFKADQFIYRDFSNGGSTRSIEDPSGALTASPKSNLVSAEPFLMDTQFGNKPRSINDPSPTQTANRKHFYLMNPQYSSKGASINDPCFTLIARMDKQPPYLIETESGDVAIEVYDTDTEHMVKIKEFMALYGIVDVKMRMLNTKELLKIQGFPEDYKLAGTKAHQKKFIGNAVEVNQAFEILRSSTESNIYNFIEKTA